MRLDAGMWRGQSARAVDHVMRSHDSPARSGSVSSPSCDTNTWSSRESRHRTRVVVPLLQRIIVPVALRGLYSAVVCFFRAIIPRKNERTILFGARNDES